MKVSFLLPSYRDYSPIAQVIQSIIVQHDPEPYGYEILVMSPYEVQFDSRLRWFKEWQPAGGCVAAFNFLYKQSQGDYIVLAVDDMLFQTSVTLCIQLLQSDIFQNRRFKIASLQCGGGFCFTNPGDYKQIGFPVYSRDTIERMGGLPLNPRFKHHYGDVWLSYWLGKQGEPGMHCCEARIKHVTGEHRTDTDERDKATWLQLVEEYGKGKESYL